MTLIEAFRRLPEDENELRARTARAARAKALLGDEMLKGALQAVRDTIVKQLTTGPVNDLDRLRQYRLMYELLDMIADAIGQHVNTGILAEDALKQIERRGMFGRK